MTKKTEVYYGLREIRNGNMVRVGSVVEEPYAPAKYVLSNNPKDPVFQVPSAEAAAFVLMEDTSTYSSSEECPSWGTFKPEQLEVVKVSQILEILKVDMPKPLQYQVRETPRRLPRVVLSQYLAGRELDPAVKFAHMGLVTLGKDMTFEDAKAYEGQKVYPETNKFGGRKLLLSLPVSPEYSDVATIPNVALFIFEE